MLYDKKDHILSVFVEFFLRLLANKLNKICLWTKLLSMKFTKKDNKMFLSSRDSTRFCGSSSLMTIGHQKNNLVHKALKRQLGENTKT